MEVIIYTLSAAGYVMFSAVIGRVLFYVNGRGR